MGRSGLFVAGVVVLAAGIGGPWAVRRSAAEDAGIAETGAAVGAVSAGSSVPQKESGVRGKFVVGRETTRISGPVMADGRIDYEGALRAKRREGVTAENNAGAVFWAALGREWPAGEPGGPAARVTKVGFEQLYKKRMTEAESKERNEAYRRIDAGQAWRGAEFPAVAGWLREQERALAAAEAASRREKFYLPERTSDVLGVMADCRYIAEGVCLRACLRAGERDSDGARADLATGHRLVRVLAGAGDMMATATADNLERRMWTAELAAMRAARTREERAALLAQARGWRELGFGVESIDVEERYGQLAGVMQAMAEGPQKIVGALTLFAVEKEMRPGKRAAEFSAGDWEQVDWNVVLRTVNRSADEKVRLATKGRAERRAGYAKLAAELGRAEVPGTMLDAVARGVPEGGDAGYEAARDQIVAQWKGWMTRKEGETREAYSERMAALFVGAWGMVVDWSRGVEETRCRQRLALAGMAVEAFRAEKGRLPERLEEAVPGYLERVPEDVFGEGAIKYRVTDGGWKVYSVGENGRDDGGERKLAEGGGVREYEKDDVALEVRR